MNLDVVIVGDEGVGKSSIITALIKDQFVSIAPNTVLPRVTVPSDTYGNLQSGHLTTIIVDTSPRRDDRHHLETELRKANVVVIVYSIEDAQSFDRIAEYWLPTIRSLGINVPCVLVGNKIDLRSAEGLTNEALEAEVLPVMQAYKEIETCVECSAKDGVNIAEIFYFAQRAVLYPTAPLYDSREHSLKPGCVNALRRIFKLCDADKDGLLNDTELNLFQRKCFAGPLQQSELDGIKEVVRQYSPEATTEEGLTLEGFLYLNTLFIQKGRLETTWTALRKFGYGPDVQLKEEHIAPRFDVPNDCSVELSPMGCDFLSDLFQRHDKDQDGALSPDELEDLFSTSPGNPWHATFPQQTTVTNEEGYVTLQGWLAQWSMTTLLDHRLTLSYLAYLGYQAFSNPPVPLTSALTFSAPRKSERKKDKSTRNVYSALLLGAAGSGKSTLLRSFVGKGSRSAHEPTIRRETVVNSVEFRGAEKYLVLQEYGRDEPEILRSSKKLSAIDVILYVYDSADTNSFSYISNLRATYKLDHIPCVFVATKSDLDLAVQRHEVQPDLYCKRLFLRPPVSVSYRHNEELWSQVVQTAMSPNGSLPGGVQKSRMNLWKWSLVIGGVGLVGFASWRLSSRGFKGILSFLPLFRSSGRGEL